VLECMARHSGMIVMQTQLIREVWGPTHPGDSRSLRVCIKNLRSKLEPSPHRPQYLVTERGLDTGCGRIRSAQVRNMR